MHALRVNASHAIASCSWRWPTHCSAVDDMGASAASSISPWWWLAGSNVDEQGNCLTGYAGTLHLSIGTVWIQSATTRRSLQQGTDAAPLMVGYDFGEGRGSGWRDLVWLTTAPDCLTRCFTCRWTCSHGTMP